MKRVVIIAARGGVGVKTRLAGCLTPGRREALAESMLDDMLSAIARCAQRPRTYVTTPTPALARVAARHGAVVVLEGDEGNLNLAFGRARARLAADYPDAALMLLPGDLPRLSPQDVGLGFAAAAPGSVALAAATADGGTGAVVTLASVPFPLAFGPGSLGKHIAAARTLGLEVQMLRAAGLECDLDRPADLDAFLAFGGMGRTAGLLRTWRVAA